MKLAQHGKGLVTEKDILVLNVQAALSLICKRCLDSSTGKDRLPKYHTGPPPATQVFHDEVTWSDMVMLGPVQPSLLPLPRLKLGESHSRAAL